MTTGPKLRVGGHLLPGVLAVALFGLIALIVLNTPFESGMTGFEGVSVTSEIGYALLDLTALQSTEYAIGDTEQFLVSFFLAAIVLDAALDASLVLAKREEGGEPVSALSTTTSRTSADEGAQPTVADGGTDANARTGSTGGENA